MQHDVASDMGLHRLSMTLSHVPGANGLWQANLKINSTMKLCKIIQSNFKQLAKVVFKVDLNGPVQEIFHGIF